MKLLDLLGGRLAFERTGVRLYERVIQKIELGNDPRYRRLVDQLRHIRDEEKEHEEWIEAQIRGRGGDVNRMTAMAALETEESQGIEHVILNGHTEVMHLLHALLSAELADNAGWDLLIKMSTELGDRSLKKGCVKRMAHEAEHLAFVREALLRTANIVVLGREDQLPVDMKGVVTGTMKRPLALGGLFGLLLVGAGAAIAASLFIARPELGMRSRRRLSLPPF